VIACDGKWFVIVQGTGEMSGEDGLGSQSYVPFSLPKDPDTAEEATKYVFYYKIVSTRWEVDV